MRGNVRDPLFADRSAAGRALAAKLAPHARRRDVIVLGLPRGGVPVAELVARELRVPLDLVSVRKLGVPGHEEYAMGAIASGGVVELDESVVRQAGISRAMVRDVLLAETEELERRDNLYRGDRPFPDVRGRVAILVDDGMATGSTMRAAVNAVRQRMPAAVLVAVPVAAVEACADLAQHVNECICVHCPSPFHAVGVWYQDFRATTDDEVLACLARARAAELSSRGQQPAQERERSNDQRTRP